MQQTTTYNLKLIETSDPFSPDALNANAQTLEAQLARVDAALLAEQSARLSAAAAEKNRVDAALAQRPRMVYGTYTGSGSYGKNNPNRLDFASTLGCAPKLLFVCDSASEKVYQLVAVNGTNTVFSFPGNVSTNEYFCYFTWTETGVEWYNKANATRQMSEARTYYYVAFA